MRKRFIIICLLAVFMAAFTFCYLRTNRLIPRPVVTMKAFGETFQTKSGIEISITGGRFLSGAEETPPALALPYSYRTYQAKLQLENPTDQDASADISDVMIETDGYANGWVDCSGDTDLALRPHEKQELMMAFQIIQQNFSPSAWTGIEKRDFWLTFGDYPEKTELQLPVATA